MARERSWLLSKLTFGKGTTKRERGVTITIPFKALSRHLPASQVHLLSALHVRMMNTHTCVLLKIFSKDPMIIRWWAGEREKRKTATGEINFPN